MVARFPRPAFEYRELQRYQPQVSAPVAWFGAIQFAVLLNCVALFLWNADRMPLSQSTVWLAALAAENMVLQHQVFKPLAMALAMVAVAKASAGLDPVLRIAVGAYVVVIALMAAQAIGRATVLRDKRSVAVAAGAGLFMLSDALLAIDKFALPLPMAQFWVLATYYAAQILIVGGMLRAPQPAMVTRSRPLQEAAPAA